MIYLGYLIFFILYFLLSVLVVVVVSKWARKRGRRAGRWGFWAGFVMYNLVFWDFLPTWLLYKYHCVSTAGYWVYTTPEEWRKQHPDAVVKPVEKPEGVELDEDGRGTMTLTDGSRAEVTFEISRDGYPYFYIKKKNNVTEIWLNGRFMYRRNEKKYNLFPVFIYNHKIIDRKNNNILFNLVSVSSEHGPLDFGGGDWRIIKFWLRFPACHPGPTNGLQYMSRGFTFLQNGDYK